MAKTICTININEAVIVEITLGDMTHFIEEYRKTNYEENSEYERNWYIKDGIKYHEFKHWYGFYGKNTNDKIELEHICTITDEEYNSRATIED